LRVSAHRAVEVAQLLKRSAEVERGLGVIALSFDRLAIGGRGAGMVAQILAGETEIEPDRGGRVTLAGAFQQGCGSRMVAVFPRQSPEPRHGLRILRNNIQDGPPRFARLWPIAGLIKRSGLFQKCLALRHPRDRPIEMYQRAVKIFCRSRDARGEQMRGRIAGALCKAALDMAAGRLNFTLGEQHGGHQMTEHGLAGLAGKTLLAQPARLFTLAGIEGGGGAANDVFGGGLGHAKDIRTKETIRNTPSSFAEGGRWNTPGTLDSIFGGGDYWAPAFAGMTLQYAVAYCAASAASSVG
jgi:hypothetical protein